MRPAEHQIAWARLGVGRSRGASVEKLSLTGNDCIGRIETLPVVTQAIDVGCRQSTREFEFGYESRSLWLIPSGTKARILIGSVGRLVAAPQGVPRRRIYNKIDYIISAGIGGMRAREPD